MITFEDDDILRGKIVTPNFYRVKIEDVEEKISSKGDSTNYFLKGRILSDQNGGQDFAGVPTPHWMFNSKAKGFMIGFFKAFGVDVKGGTRVEIRDTIGKEILVKIGNKLYEGRTVNELVHEYMPAKVA